MNDKTEVKKEVKNFKDENGAYLTAYDLLKSLFWHMTNKNECKGFKIENNSSKEEVGWKCSKCGDEWRIAVRKLRNTIRDNRLREFGGFAYMSTFADLRKVLEKK